MSSVMIIDVILNDGETWEDVAQELVKRYPAITVQLDDGRNQHPTIRVSGPQADLDRVSKWHTAQRNPRPDLKGKPPVSKGEKRI